MHSIEKTLRIPVLGLLVPVSLVLAVGLFGEKARKNTKNGQSPPPYGKSVWEIPGWRSPVAPPPPKSPERRDSRTRPGKLLPVAPEAVPSPPKPLEPLTFSGLGEKKPGGDPSVPVLCYHQNFAGGDQANEFNVTPAAFEAQLAYLRRNKYTSIGLDDLYYYVSGEGRGGLPARPVVITFDDGIKSNRTVVAALLEKYDFTAVLFVYPSVLDGNNPSYLNWNDLRTLVATGRFEIGSHTLDHPLLPRENRREIRRQLEQSRLLLQKELGVQVYDLAYPFGLYDRRVMEEARRSGYRMAFTINMGTGRPGMDAFALPRIMITREFDLERFAASLRIHSPERVELNPPDGTRVGPGQQVRFRISEIDPDSLDMRLNGIRLGLARRNAAFHGILPTYTTASGFLPLTIRGRLKDGRAFYRQFLYIHKGKR